MAGSTRERLPCLPPLFSRRTRLFNRVDASWGSSPLPSWHGIHPHVLRERQQRCWHCTGPLPPPPPIRPGPRAAHQSSGTAADPGSAARAARGMPAAAVGQRGVDRKPIAQGGGDERHAHGPAHSRCDAWGRGARLPHGRQPRQRHLQRQRTTATLGRTAASSVGGVWPRAVPPVNVCFFSCFLVFLYCTRSGARPSRQPRRGSRPAGAPTCQTVGASPLPAFVARHHPPCKHSTLADTTTSATPLAPPPSSSPCARGSRSVGRVFPPRYHPPVTPSAPRRQHADAHTPDTLAEGVARGRPTATPAKRSAPGGTHQNCRVRCAVPPPAACLALPSAHPLTVRCGGIPRGGRA